jgi:hypothetical protein
MMQARTHMVGSVQWQVIGWTARVGFSAEGRDCSFSTVTRLALGPTQPPIQRVQGLSYQEYSGQDMKLAPYLHLIQRSRMMKLYLISLSSWHSAQLSTGATHIQFIHVNFWRLSNKTHKCGEKTMSESKVAGKILQYMCMQCIHSHCIFQTLWTEYKNCH